jgi:hypothetical protein
MQFTDGNVSLKAFNALCEELSTSKLVSLEECQYWMFERGYKAALEELIGNISAATKAQQKASHSQGYLVQETLSQQYLRKQPTLN